MGERNNVNIGSVALIVMASETCMDPIARFNESIPIMNDVASNHIFVVCDFLRIDGRQRHARKEHKVATKN